MATVTVATSTNAVTTQADARLIRIAPNGDRWALVYASGYKFYRSTDKGATWSFAQNAPSASTQDFTFTADGVMHVVSVSQTDVHYWRGVVSGSSITFDAAFSVYTSNYLQKGNISAIRSKANSTSSDVYITWVYQPGGTTTTQVYSRIIRAHDSGTNTQAITNVNNIGSTGTTGAFTASDVSPSATFFTALVGAGHYTRIIRHLYNAGTDTWDQVSMQSTLIHQGNEVTGAWVKDRFVMFAIVYNSSGSVSGVHAVESSNTLTNYAAMNPGVGAYVQNVSLSYQDNGDYYLYVTGNTNFNIMESKWTRSTATWSAWTQRIAATCYQGSLTTSRPGTLTDIEFLWWENVTGNPTKYDRVTFNNPPTAPTVTAANGGETWDKTHSITWNAATDPDGDALQYQIQLTTDNGATWKTIVALTAANATSYSYDFSGEPETTQARLRIRAYDGTVYGPWDESNANFTISHAPPTPTAVTPSAGATVNTDLPTLGMTLTSWTAQQKGRWQLATTSDFATNMREISEPDADLKTGGATTEPTPAAAELFQGVWYIRGRAVSATGALSAWTAAHTFTVSHPPSTTNHSPTGDAVMLYDTGDVTLSWKFSDTSPTDTQTARQVVVERNSDGLVIVDTGKVATAAESVTVNIPLTHKGEKLRWKIRVWDSDDVVGSYSSYHTFTMADAPTVDVTAPVEGSEINTATPKVEWTFTGYGGRTQRERRVIFTHTANGTVVHDSGWAVTTATSYTPSSTDMVTAEGYTVKVEVRDTSYLYGSDSNNFTTSWVPPDSVTWYLDMGTVEDGGYAKLTWDDAQKDAEWYSWQVWRRPVGGDWKVLREFRTSKPQFEYRDYTFESGTQYEWSVVEVVQRFGNLVVGPVYPRSGTPSPSDYWLVYSNEEADWEKNFRLHIVVGDEFSDPYEQAETHLIGRGRHVDYGDRLGYAGVLTVEVRSQERLGITGRDQRMRLEAFHAEKGSAFLRNPFGDLFRVASGDLQMSRLAGVGNREFGTVTIPYYEVTE